jgi:hypothetical protein
MIGGGMLSDDAKQLAYTMIRHHGKLRALKLADTYAREAMAQGDERNFARWSAATSHIGDLIELAQNFKA